MIALILEQHLLNSSKSSDYRETIKRSVLLAIKLLLQQAAPTVWHIPPLQTTRARYSMINLMVLLRIYLSMGEDEQCLTLDKNTLKYGR